MMKISASRMRPTRAAEFCRFVFMCSFLSVSLLNSNRTGLLQPAHRSQTPSRVHGHDFPADALSDGTLRFACLATLLLMPEPPDTIVIDEPELGLHPYALS